MMLPISKLLAFQKSAIDRSQSSSIEIPRCVMQLTDPEEGFNVYVERHSHRDQNQAQRLQNSTNNSGCVTPGPRRLSNYNRTYPERPETPQRFGGMGRQTRPFAVEQFGLSQNEQFHSPRGVFQNLDYDRFQTHKSPMPARLTEEVIASFDNARPHRAPLNETKDNDARQKLCVRLQKVRDQMNRKPQVDIKEQIEIEPELYHYEPITLQEPCEHEHSSSRQETEQDLGILSESDMDDDTLFGDQQIIDPRTIFKTKDENLVSRNVVKIETNTTINGSKREVVEEILEQEDVNVEERPEEDEHLVDISEPTFESIPGYSPLQLSDHVQKRPGKWQSKPRRILEDYSNLPAEDLDDISQPCFQQKSFCPSEEETSEIQYISRQNQNREDASQSHTGRRKLVVDSERLDEVSQPPFVSSIDDPMTRTPFRRGGLPYVNESERIEDVCQPDFSSTIREPSRRRNFFVGIENSERLENISQPIYASSLENTLHRPIDQFEESEQLENIEQPDYQSFEESTNKSRKSKATSRQKPFLPTDTLERLDQVSQPGFVSTFEDSTVKSSHCRGLPPQRRLPQFETPERLDDVSQPEFLHSTEVSYQDSTSRRCPLKQSSMVASRRSKGISPCRYLPQVKLAERLDEVSQPDFLHSMDMSYQDATSRRCPSRHRQMPQIDTSERIDQISLPAFMSSFNDSTVTSRQRKGISTQRRLPQVETSERLDEVSQPALLNSTEITYQDSSNRRCPLSQIIHPGFVSSLKDSTVTSRQRKCISPCRRLPLVETSERLDEVSEPGLLHRSEMSYQDSSNRRCPLSQRQIPQVNTSERLDQINRPSFVSSVKDSTRVSRRSEVIPPHRRLPLVEISERLEEVSQPGFLNSTGANYNDSTSRRCPFSQAETSENLDQISCPSFDSTLTSRKSRCYERLPQVSERLDEVSHPQFLSSVEDSCQDYRKMYKCPLTQRPLPQVEVSEQLDHVSQPSAMTSLKDTTPESRDRRFPPEVDTCKRLDQVSHPEFLSSIGGCNGEKLDEVSQPVFQSSFEESRMRSKGGRQTLISGRQCHANKSEWLDDICYPEFPSSFEDTSNTQRTRSRNVSERLDHITQPSFPKSFEESLYRPRDNSEILNQFCETDSTTKEIRYTQAPRTLPQVDESEILDAVVQPDLTSFEDDTGYGSKDSGQTLAQRPLCQVEELERVDEVSQPHFEHSYKDSTLGSNESRRTRPLSYVETSEILDHVCQPEFPPSFENSIRSGQSVRQAQKMPLPQYVESERLDDVCQPSFQSTFENSNRRRIQESSKSSRKSNEDRRQRLISRVNVSEELDDISQPFLPLSFEDSMNDRRNRKGSAQRQNDASRRLYHDSQSDRFHVSQSEHLDNVTQPVFPSSFEDSRQPSRQSERTQSRRSGNKTESSERLNDVSQPFFPMSFEDSMKSSNKYNETPKRWPLPDIDGSENLDDMSYPSFPSTHEDSSYRPRRCENVPIRKPLPQVDESEKLEDVSQPGFPSSFKHSTAISRGSRLYQSHGDSSKRGQSHDNRPLPQINVSEELKDVSQPDFGISFESTIPRSMHTSEQRPLIQANVSIRTQPRNRRTPQHKYLPQVDVSERLEDVCRPDFPNSFEDSRQNSTRNKSRSYQKQYSREMPNNVHQRDVSCSLDRSVQKPTMQQPQFNTSEILEDVAQPEFQSTLQESKNFSRERRRRTPIERRPMLQIDLSENIESVCQPEFPQSFEDSTRNEMYNATPSTYRKDYNYAKFPEENLADISAPTFCFNYQNSMQRGSGIPHLPEENLEDISCPSFQATPISTRRQLEDSRSRGPQRQLFPKQDLRSGITERPGDFRQVFETMPNYAPFEHQVASKRNPSASRLKMPATFGYPVDPSTKNKEFRRPEMISQPRDVTRPEFRANRMNQVDPCTLQVPKKRIQIERRDPNPTASSTRIPLPPSARSQKNAQRHQQQIEKPADQERLVKKSSVKFHQTKSTYFKNQQNKSNGTQCRRR